MRSDCIRRLLGDDCSARHRVSGLRQGGAYGALWHRGRGYVRQHTLHR